MKNDHHDKLLGWSVLKILSLLKKVAKIHFLGLKMYFLGFGKRKKTTVYSEVKSNLKKLITLGMFATDHESYFSFKTGTKNYNKKKLFLIFFGFFFGCRFWPKLMAFWPDWRQPELIATFQRFFCYVRTYFEPYLDPCGIKKAPKRIPEYQNDLNRWAIYKKQSIILNIAPGKRL